MADVHIEFSGNLGSPVFSNSVKLMGIGEPVINWPSISPRPLVYALKNNRTRDRYLSVFDRQGKTGRWNT